MKSTSRAKLPSTKRRSRRARRKPDFYHPAQRTLFVLSDHGTPASINPQPFVGGRARSWERFLESFLRLNEPALNSLDVRPQVEGGQQGMNLKLVPGGRAGAVPLRSSYTGTVQAGLLVKPRFGWSGIGNVLRATGWSAMPSFPQYPLVPGSGREVPPWVLAGPVLARLNEMLRDLTKGYEEKEEIRTQPRGKILWPRYIGHHLSTGRWHRLPCRYPNLDADPRVQGFVRWTLERIRRMLEGVGGTDPIAHSLATVATRLIESLAAVKPLRPTRSEIATLTSTSHVVRQAFLAGIEAVSWVVEERGLGGGQELDGLPWTLALDELWERYVEAVYRKEARLNGGEIRTARSRETTVPIRWSPPSHRSLSHLIPDIVIRRGRVVHIIDAKYKAHFNDLDSVGWRRFTDDAREAHRADVHQILAYTSLIDADEIIATLVYPLRTSTWQSLADAGQDLITADLSVGGRRISLHLRGLVFGGPPGCS